MVVSSKLSEIIEVKEAELIGKALTQAEVGAERDWLRIMNASLMYYLHIPEPSLLSDEEWACRVKELQWIRKMENGKED